MFGILNLMNSILFAQTNILVVFLRKCFILHKSDLEYLTLQLRDVINSDVFDNEKIISCAILKLCISKL